MRTHQYQSDIERQTRHKYRTFYRASSRETDQQQANDYFQRLSQIRLRLVHDSYVQGCVVDLCCGSGDYLLRVARFAQKIIGIDFSPEQIADAESRVASNGLTNTSFCVANARYIPLRNASAAVIFSFSSLYYIPNVEQVVHECARILAEGGIAVLEFGILHSLNTIVCRAYPELAAPIHIPLRRVHKIVTQAGLIVEDSLAFQILPLWGSRPVWLRPFLSRRWKKVLAHDIGHRMLDQLISDNWLFRSFAFRHIVVCRKPAV